MREYGGAGQGVVRHDMVWYGLIEQGMVWDGAGHGMVWYRMGWDGTV